ncbi:MAG: PAS domain S-box protein [Dehalococcoidia bacterium]|nr:MAG: PAS domain S-box protein [Dehalococcoidia bacterium]
MAKRSGALRTKHQQNNAQVSREWMNGFSAFMEVSLDACVLFDENLNLLSANSAAGRLIGLSNEAARVAVGKNIVDLVPDVKETGRYEKYLSVVRTGEPFIADDIVRHPESGDIHLSVKALKVGNGLAIITSDITQRKKVEHAVREKEEHFRALIENSLEGIAVLGGDGTIKYESPSVKQVVGWEPEELLGRNMLELIHPDDVQNAAESLERLFKGLEQTASMRVRFLHKDGSWRIIEGVARNLLHDPKVNGIVANYRDVTERQQMEQALRESEDRFRNVLDNSFDMVYRMDLETERYDYVSPSSERLLGYTPGDFIALGPGHAASLIHPDDVDMMSQSIIELMAPTDQEHKTRTIEYRIKHREVGYRWVADNISVIHDDRKVPVAVVGNVRDITVNKLAEGALRESEEKLRLMFESVTDGITVTDLEGKIVQVNDAALGLHGYDSKEELIGHNAFELIAKKDHARATKNLKRTLKEGFVRDAEYTLLAKEGKEFAGELSAAVIRDASGAPAGFIAVTRDVTERKVAEDSLRHKEEYFRALTENSSDFIAVLNSDGSVRYESPSVERVLGRKPEERIGDDGLENVHPEDVPEVVNSLARLVQNPGTTVHVQSRFRHKDGSWRVLDGVVQNLLDNPAVAGIVANLRDITEQKKAEQALRESEHNYRALFESRIDGAAVIDAETMKVVLANPTAMEMYGFDSMEEVAEANLVDYLHPDDRDRALKAIAEDLFEKDLCRVEEFRTLTKDGGVRWIAAAGTRVEYQGRLAGLVSFRDITEQKRTAEKLRELYEQERESRQQVEAEMKKRVEFTRALAHELKTPLTAVLASSDLLASELHDEALETLANSIRQGASNLDSRIDELLDIARGEVGLLQLRLEAVDLSQLLRETADIMTPVALQRGLPLVLALPVSLPPVRADAARVQQVVTNLLSNALKFTPLGGNIRLGARQRGSTVVVEVRDTGRGMSKEEQKGLFEPYHRLDRDPSGGLGLGLALCKMLVELHGGQIWVRSNVGRGSTFGFSLPLEAADEHAIESEEERKLWKVLIVEDDQEIVSVVRLAFQMRWPEAQLISTSLGEEGAELVETENPDLVILDLGLPDISGFDVLREIRLFSSVPVVILTVKADEADMVKGLEWGADDYVVKPFRQLELLARLKVQLRKQIPPGEEAPIISGSLRLDPSTYQLTYGGKEISLTIVEGRIMQHLMQNAGHVITHTRLAEAVWGEDHPGAVDSLRVYIRYLREKLEADPSHPKLILTKVGIGYLLAKPV